MDSALDSRIPSKGGDTNRDHRVLKGHWQAAEMAAPTSSVTVSGQISAALYGANVQSLVTLAAAETRVMVTSAATAQRERRHRRGASSASGAAASVRGLWQSLNRPWQ
jgi:hypothetical protein